MLLQLDQVSKQYNGFRLNCSLSVPEGRVVGLIGQNGAGKSTAFKAALDLIRIDGGTVRLFGKDLREITTADKEKIGVVLADSGFSEALSIQAIVPVMKSLYHRFEKGNFLAQCGRFGLPLKKPIKSFSTGMKAKLKLLLAISHGAKLLILDEPTAGMDVVAREELLDLLREYMEIDGRSVLISSHISSDLEQFCDDCYLIHQGEVVLHEETDRLLDCYGMIKADSAQYAKLDKNHLLRVKKEPFGYCALTDQRRFYQENYPELMIEKGSIDQVITMMTKGERV